MPAHIPCRAADGQPETPAAQPQAIPDGAGSQEIAAAAERHRQAADAYRQQAERDRAAGEEILTAARAEVARIMTAAETKARPLTASALTAEKEAEAGTERAERLGNAARISANAETSEARVKALEDERDELAGKQADLARRLAELSAERRDLEPQLAAALEGADLDLITSLRGRLASIQALEESLTAQQAALLTRLDAIGDGELSPIWPQRELAEVRRIAGGDRHQAHAALNYALPDRPEAVADRARALDRAITDQRAAEAERQPAQPQRRVVHL